MRIKVCLFFAAVGLMLSIAGSGSYSQTENSALSGDESIFEKMEKSSQHYYIEPAFALGDSITVDDYVDIYFPLVKPHEKYPKVIFGRDSTILLSSFKFDSLAIEKIRQGTIQFIRGEVTSARELFEQAADVSDSCYVAFLKIGDCYMASGESEKALEYYKKAYDINPFDYVTSLSMGRIYMAMNRNDEALEKFIEALTLMPRNQEILDELAKLTKVMNLELIDNSFHPQALAVRKEDGVHIYMDLMNMTPWLAYASVKALWLGENYYGDSLMAESGEKRVWCLKEEREALAALVGYYIEMKKDEKIEPDEYIERLQEIIQDGYVDGFILYEIWSRFNPDITLVMNQSLKDEVRGYISKYLVVKQSEISE